MSGTSENVNENNENTTSKDQIGTGSNSGQQNASKDGGTGLGFKSLEEAEAEIKRLRKENADRRTKSKSLEEELGSIKSTLAKMREHLGIQDDVSPEEMVANLQEQNQGLQMELALKEIVHENGIAKEDEEYFRFLLEKKFSSLEDDEELSEEALAEVVAEVQSRAQKPSSTGVNDGSGGKDPNANAGDVTVEQFAKMSSADKQALFTKNQGLYERLFKEAQEKRLL